MKPAALAARLRFWLVDAGWPGVVGLALMVAGGVMQFVLVPQQWQAAEDARLVAERQRRAYLRAASGRGDDIGDRLARFRAMLAPEAGADELLEIIQRDARAHGLRASGTEYKWLRQPEARLVQVQISVPLKGGYTAVRGFLKDVLADVPGLALEQCDLTRENISAAAADARLRFTLFLRVGT